MKKQDLRTDIDWTEEEKQFIIENEEIRNDLFYWFFSNMSDGNWTGGNFQFISNLLQGKPAPLPIAEDSFYQNEQDFCQGYCDGWKEGKKFREGNDLCTPRWQQKDVNQDDVRKYYAQGYINGYADGLAGLPCGKEVEVRKEPYSDTEF
jgi:hypothetical protein